MTVLEKREKIKNWRIEEEYEKMWRRWYRDECVEEIENDDVREEEEKKELKNWRIEEGYVDECGGDDVKMKVYLEETKYHSVREEEESEQLKHWRRVWRWMWRL